MDVIEMSKLEDVLSAVEYNGGGITELKSKGCVKSVQRGTFSSETIPIGSSCLIPITEVDEEKSLLDVFGESSSLGSGISYYDWYLTSTGIVVQNKYYQEIKFYCRWQVVEFY